MATVEHRQLLEVIDRLYAASLDHSRWEVFLGSLASMFKAKNAFICEVEHHTVTRLCRALPAEPERVPVKRYETLIDEDPRTPLFRRHPSRAAHCRMGLSAERLHASRVYREYLRPLDIEYTMVVLLPVRDGVTLDLGLTRGRGSEAFSNSECAALRERRRQTAAAAFLVAITGTTGAAAVRRTHRERRRRTAWHHRRHRTAIHQANLRQERRSPAAGPHSSRRSRADGGVIHGDLRAIRSPCTVGKAIRSGDARDRRKGYLRRPGLSAAAGFDGGAGVARGCRRAAAASQNLVIAATIALVIRLR